VFTFFSEKRKGVLASAFISANISFYNKTTGLTMPQSPDEIYYRNFCRFLLIVHPYLPFIPCQVLLTIPSLFHPILPEDRKSIFVRNKQNINIKPSFTSVKNSSNGRIYIKSTVISMLCNLG
jgi:hypothetical protein